MIPKMEDEIQRVPPEPVFGFEVQDDRPVEWLDKQLGRFAGRSAYLTGLLKRLAANRNDASTDEAPPRMQPQTAGRRQKGDTG